MAGRVNINKKKVKPVQSGLPGDTLYHKDHLLNTMDPVGKCDLQRYCLDILTRFFNETLKGRREDLTAIVKEYNGVVKLSTTDLQLLAEWKDGHPTAPPPVNPQVTKSHLENAIAFLTNTITVEDGIWIASSEPSKQAQANAIAAELVKEGQRFNHRTAIETAFTRGFVGNLGGLFIDYVNEPVPVQAVAGDGSVDSGIQMQSGNKLIPADPFNLILDTRCPPSRIFRDGEFAGYVSLESQIKIYDKLRSGEWTLCSPDDHFSPYFQNTANNDYICPPDSGIENVYGDSVITLYLRLFPKAFKLGDNPEPEIWRITLLGAERKIVNLERHESPYIPFAGFCFDPETPYNCDGGLASQLLPFQRFISYVFSGYQRALLKNISGGCVGITQGVFNLQDLSDAGKAGGFVVANMVDNDKPLRDAVVPLSQPTDVGNVAQDISYALELMQQIFPTDMLKQISSLERATQYQAAATVQAGNKRNIKVAYEVDSQMMAPLRQMMACNVLANEEMLTVINPETGDAQLQPISQFIGLDLQYNIADGLAGLDRLANAQAMQEAINSLLQLPAAAQNFDIYRALNYMLQQRGAKVDFNQFKRPVMMPAGQAQAVPGELMPAGSPDMSGMGQIAGPNAVPNALPIGVPPQAGIPPQSPEAALLESLGGEMPADMIV